MKDWKRLLPLRLPEPVAFPDVVESESVVALTTDVLEKVLTWVRPENPRADAIVEEAVVAIVALRTAHPTSYAWARADLMAMFGADDLADEVDVTAQNIPPAVTPHRW